MTQADEHGPRGQGNLYFCVKSNLSESGEIYLWADRVRLDQTGCLIFAGGRNDGLNIAFAAGSWQAVYSVSVADSSPVAVELWPGVTAD